MIVSRNFRAMQKGFSLLEILIVVAILAVLARTGVGYYRNAVRSISTDTFTEQLIFDSKQMRSKAMAGEGSLRWGVHLVNGASDYYELFSTPTNYAGANTTATTTVYLPSGIFFSDPLSGTNKDIIFTGISGTTTATTTIITNNEGRTKTINIGSQGTIY